MSGPSRGYTLAQWLDAPHHRDAFQRVRELVPTALISRGDGPPTPFERELVDLDHVVFEGADGADVTWAEHLERSAADAVCVVHRGRIVHERYLNGMTERTPHLLMSVSKSWCGAALGIAADRGLLGLGDLVTEVAPELAGTSLDGATVRHLIDMTAGTRFVEDYDDYLTPGGNSPLLEYERQAGYRPLGDRAPIGVLGHFRGYPAERPHGAWFSYRSPLTNVAARLLEIVSGEPYAQLVSHWLWQPLGQEHDADIMLDPLGQAVVEGGMSCTLRDLARLGLAYSGRPGPVPVAWVDDTRFGDSASRTAFTAGPGDTADPGDWVMYRNAWWVERPGEVYSALGIFGQFCWVDRAQDVVIARFSTFPTALPADLSNETLRGLRAVAAHLAGR